MSTDLYCGGTDDISKPPTVCGSNDCRHAISTLREQNKWLLHELKDAANRLTALGETTLSVRDCIDNIEKENK